MINFSRVCSTQSRYDAVGDQNSGFNFLYSRAKEVLQFGLPIFKFRRVQIQPVWFKIQSIGEIEISQRQMSVNCFRKFSLSLFTFPNLSRYWCELFSRTEFVEPFPFTNIFTPCWDWVQSYAEIFT